MKYKVNIWPAKEKLTNTEYDPRKKYQGEINIGIYKCTKCEREITLSTSDFQKHFKNNHSNLSDLENELIENEYKIDSAEWESFIDFKCPGCNIAVKIIYEPVEFAMGSYMFITKKVIELVKET